MKGFVAESLCRPEIPKEAAGGGTDNSPQKGIPQEVRNSGNVSWMTTQKPAQSIGPPKNAFRSSPARNSIKPK
jgi:hypothetical protein